MTYEQRRPAESTTRLAVRRILALALVAGSSGLVASACADNESSLFVRGCVASESSGSEGCVAKAEADATFFSRGRMDLLYQGGYACWLLVGNQIVQRGDSDTLRTETSRVTLYAADVRLTTQAGDPVQYAGGGDVEFQVPLSGFVDPGTGDDPGYGLAQVLMIDALGADGIARTVAAGGESEFLATVIVHGRTLGGQEIETGEWSFPISACIGCACREPADDTCVDPEDAPDTVACSTDNDVDCRYGSAFGSGTCAQMTAAAIAQYTAGGP